MTDSFYIANILGILFIYLVLLMVCIADYVLKSLALYSVAKRRNISKPWLAWIPIASAWTLGSVADDYDFKNGINRKWRLTLIIPLLITSAAMIIFLTTTTILAIATNFTSYYPDTAIYIFIYISYLIILSVTMVYMACYTICLYKLYESTVPEKSVKYLIITLLIPLGGAICLMKSKDKGYPEPAEKPSFEII